MGHATRRSNNQVTLARETSGQKVPECFYNIQVMVGRVLRDRGQVGVCGTCMDARGITEAEMVEETRKSSLAELAASTRWADKVIAF